MIQSPGRDITMVDLCFKPLAFAAEMDVARPNVAHEAH